MPRRCIMIFPKFENRRIIDGIRERYDPLAHHVAPHITLVFPFDSDLEAVVLRGHIERSISGISPFPLVCGGITPAGGTGKYLFLGVLKGREQIGELHSRLYTGILEKYYPRWLWEKTYLPHMTVGSFSDDEDIRKAIEETRKITSSFETMVREISMEIIDDNKDSILEMTVPLR